MRKDAKMTDIITKTEDLPKINKLIHDRFNAEINFWGDNFTLEIIDSRFNWEDPDDIQEFDVIDVTIKAEYNWYYDMGAEFEFNLRYYQGQDRLTICYGQDEESETDISSDFVYMDLFFRAMTKLRKSKDA